MVDTSTSITVVETLVPASLYITCTDGDVDESIEILSLPIGNDM